VAESKFSTATHLHAVWRGHGNRNILVGQDIFHALQERKKGYMKGWSQ